MTDESRGAEHAADARAPAGGPAGDGGGEASTLANVHAGDDARITRILFGALRSLCDDLGLRENQRFHCRAATPTMLVLEAEDGNIVSLARDWARFIRVEPAPTGSSRS
jgi:hypothetical protein